VRSADDGGMERILGDKPIRRTCLLVDLESYSRRDGPEQLKAQELLAQALDTAAAELGLHRESWARQDQGDGELAVLPLTEPDPIVVGEFPGALQTALGGIHRQVGQVLRVRLAINAGMVQRGAKGFAGDGPVHAERMMNAAQVRAVLAAVPEAYLVAAVSSGLYKELVLANYTSVSPRDFTRVQVPRIGAETWVLLPGVDPSRIGRAEAEPEKPGGVTQQAFGKAAAIAQAGRDNNRSATGTNAQVYNNDFRGPVHAGTFIIGPRTDRA
jgi:hypothetical protein